MGGAVAGGVAAGLSSLGASTWLSRPIASGASSFAQGGNREGALLSMGLAVTGLVASSIYQKVVRYEIDPRAGGDAVNKDPSVDMPVKGANNIGTAGEVDPNSIWGEGGYVSRFANRLPLGINAVGGMHDVFQIRLEEWGGQFARNLFNVPGMAVAAMITYPRMLDVNPAFPAVVADQIRR